MAVAGVGNNSGRFFSVQQAPAVHVIRAGCAASLIGGVNGQSFERGRPHESPVMEVGIVLLQQEKRAGHVRGGHGGAAVSGIGLIIGCDGRIYIDAVPHQVRLNPPVVGGSPGAVAGYLYL